MNIEERADKYYPDYSYGGTTRSGKKCREAYINGANEIIDKACGWLCEHIGEYARLGEDGAWIEHSVVKDFRKAMKE